MSTRTKCDWPGCAETWPAGIDNSPLSFESLGEGAGDLCFEHKGYVLNFINTAGEWTPANITKGANGG